MKRLGFSSRPSIGVPRRNQDAVAVFPGSVSCCGSQPVVLPAPRRSCPPVCFRHSVSTTTSARCSRSDSVISGIRRDPPPCRKFQVRIFIVSWRFHHRCPLGFMRPEGSRYRITECPLPHHRHRPQAPWPHRTPRRRRRRDPHRRPGCPLREDLVKSPKRATILITWVSEKVDAALLDAAGPQLKAVCNFAVGVDNIDLPACRRSQHPGDQHARRRHRGHRRHGLDARSSPSRTALVDADRFGRSAEFERDGNASAPPARRPRTSPAARS